MARANSTQQEQQRRKRRHWQQHLTSWQGSGLTQAEYCRRNKLSPKCFTYWHRKFKQLSRQPQLVPVPVITESAVKASGKNQAALKVELNSRFTIEVHDGFSRETLARLLSVLTTC